MAEDFGVEYYLAAEDERYPTLVLHKDRRSVGYSLDINTLELRRVCLCNAYSSSECLCGAWDAEPQ